VDLEIIIYSKSPDPYGVELLYLLPFFNSFPKFNYSFFIQN